MSQRRRRGEKGRKRGKADTSSRNEREKMGSDSGAGKPWGGGILALKGGGGRGTWIFQMQAGQVARISGQCGLKAGTNCKKGGRKEKKKERRKGEEGEKGKGGDGTKKKGKGEKRGKRKNGGEEHESSRGNERVRRA